MSEYRKAALVTGATGKIGQTVCFELARAGYDIAVHYHRSEERAVELVEKIRAEGRHAVALEADLSRAKGCDELVTKVYEGLGAVDVFVHAVSTYNAIPFGSIAADEWDEQVALNLRAPFLLSQIIGNRMVKEKRGGSIVHFTDVSAMRPYINYIPYCMCKAGVDSLVRGLAVKLAPWVRVNAIAPYLVREGDQLNEHDRELIARTPLKRHTEPNEIARLVKMLADELSTMTGQTLVIDGGRSLMW